MNRYHLINRLTQDFSRLSSSGRRQAVAQLSPEHPVRKAGWTLFAGALPKCSDEQLTELRTSLAELSSTSAAAVHNRCSTALDGDPQRASERAIMIDRLDRSFQVLPLWAKSTVKHALGAPSINPATNQPFTTFREVLEAASDHTLLILKEDFEDNDDLLP